ncbi:MAG: SBBP repeat-containing protein [Thermoplasmatales archaeon]|nr:MAG: SBBP repeat-containing protein [Thermoplasmatales archaeon]
MGVEKLSNDTYADDILIIKPKIVDDFNSTPLFFTENKGQFPDEVLFQTHISDTTVYLCQNKIVSVFTRTIENKKNDAWDNNQIHLNRMRMKESQQHEIISIVAEFVDANPDTVVIGKHPLPHKNNYFIGNNPAQWYTDVSNYKSIIYQDIYPGIDLIYYGSDDLFKYDFIIEPGANPTQIAVHYQGAENIQMTPEGDLKITTRFGSIYEGHPVIYQEIDGVQHHVTGNYLLNDDVFRFVILEPYNQECLLIIDPELVYSTYLGGSDYTLGTGIAVDSSGCAYVTGYTYSNDFPLVNPYNDTLEGKCDVFVTMFSPQGNSLEYSTYIGGIDTDVSKDIIIDNSGRSYVTGYTLSNDFPLVNPYDDTLAGDCDVFVLKLSSSGNALLYSTLFGGAISDFTNGDDYGQGIEVDISGSAYVAGYTMCYDFPTENPFDGTFGGADDVFVTKLSPEGNSLIYSTYLGGWTPDECHGIAIDDEGCAYVTGMTYEDFPMINAYDSTPNGEEETFVTKLSPQGNTLEYSTYLGGNTEDWGREIAVDSNNCVYVIGITKSIDFPTVNPYDDTYNGNTDVYVTKFSSQGNTLEYSTFIGGNERDSGFSIEVDSSGCAYITGGTESNNFPMVNSYDDTYNDHEDVFVTKFTPQGNKLEYSTYLGGKNYDRGYGIAIDSSDCAYIYGRTESTDFPLENPFDDTLNSPKDAFVTKFSGDGGGIEVKPTFLLGFIDNVEQGGNFTNINAKLLITARFIPFDIRVLSSSEKIIISNNYLGFVGKKFMIGRFKADLD